MLQADVFVAERVLPQPLAQFAIPGGVSRCVHLFPSGSLGCEDSSGFLLIRDGGTIDSLRGYLRPSFAGPTMWMSDRRVVEVDGRLQATYVTRTAFEAIATGNESVGFGATEDAGPVRFDFDGGAVVVTPLGLEGLPTVGTMTRDGGAWWGESSSGGEVCLNPLLPGGMQRCIRAPTRAASLQAAAGYAWLITAADMTLVDEDDTRSTGRIPATHSIAPPFLNEFEASGDQWDFTLIEARDGGLRFVSMGEDCTGAGTSDVIDASVRVLTSDPPDLPRLDPKLELVVV